MKKHSRIKRLFRELEEQILNQKECTARNPSDTLLSIKFDDNHMHHHYPSNKDVARGMVEDLASVVGVDLKPKDELTIVEKKPIIFKNRQAIGDILMMTAGLRDFKNTFPDWPVNVISTAMHIWDGNPYLDRSLTPDNATVVEIGPGFLTNASNRDDRHFANAFRISMEEKLGVSIKQGAIKPDIWMTKEEIKNPIIEPPYWIIVAGEKGDWTAKTYPFSRWEKIVASFPNIKFVQIGAKEHKHPKLIGDNVVNMIGKTQSKDKGIRDLFNLFYFAEGSMGLVSFQMHLAAAFGMPCVVVAGAREPARFTRFPGHQYLATDGCLPCAATTACWHCDLEKTCPTIIEKNGQRFPKCVDIIKTEDVIQAISQYYDGGRLSFDHPRVPTLPNNLGQKIEMPMAPVVRSCKIDPDKTVDPSKYGYKWGGACITDQDWAFIAKVLGDYKIQTILEFGPGLSSFLFVERGKQVVALETNPSWIKKLEERGLDKKINLNQWNGLIIPNEKDIKEFDLALVDGPPGGKARDVSTRIASEHAKIVIIHDAGREWEKKWQDKYLKDKFDGPIKGGHRCHLWIKKGESKPVEKKQLLSPVIKGQKVFRLFCNTRGDGGCGRSIDYFMKAFLKIGWRVEYVYTNPQPSGTHRRCGSPDVIATNNLELLRAPCDVFLLASDDFVWEFKTNVVSEMFKGVNAKRKVMYVNYKIGNIGTIPWTRDFDKYLFLNEVLASAFTINCMKAMKDQFYSIGPIILPPPADVSIYLDTDIDYSGEMRIVRHSSQGDVKYSKDFDEKVEAILEIFPKATIRLMPGPSFISDYGERVIIHPRNKPEVSDFLKLGNIYWYDLPENYTEGGPRVILEAMATGLPVIATNNPGPMDRITKETGFLYDEFEEASSMFEKLNNPVIREKMGKAAKKHAKEKFDPNQWIKYIIGE